MRKYFLSVNKLSEKSKQKILDNLYTWVPEKYNQRPKLELEVDIYTANKVYTDVSITLLERTLNGVEIDCNINHFGYNFYLRTNKGMKYEKYKTLNGLIKSVTKLILKTFRPNKIEFNLIF